MGPESELIGLSHLSYKALKERLELIRSGSNFYFPSIDQIPRGRYEIWVFSTFKPQCFADDSEQYLVEGAVRLLDKLNKQ